MKVLFYLSALIYAVTGYVGALNPMYVETESVDRCLGRLLPLLIGCAVVIAAGYFVWFRKVFPKGYEKQRIAGKIAIPIIFACLSLAFNVGFIKLYNRSFGIQTPVLIKGHIIEKTIKKERKRRKSYLVTIYDSGKTVNYKIEVKRTAFDQLENVGTSFKKEFIIGSLGMIYRKDI